MRLSSCFFAIVVLLLAAEVAAQQDKTPICHVGNELGPNNEMYNSECVPVEDNDFFCPDAGKIDLIFVANADKHLNNPNHSWNGMPDYQPGEWGASGEGTEDSDGNGIDDGCEPDTCPCWDESDLETITSDNILLPGIVSCDFSTYPMNLKMLDSSLSIAFEAVSNPDESDGPIFRCIGIFSDGSGTGWVNVTQKEADHCIDQLAEYCADIDRPVVNSD